MDGGLTMWRSLPANGLLTAVVALAVLVVTGLQLLMPLFGLTFEVSTVVKAVSGTVFAVDVAFVAAFNLYWKAIWRRWPKLGEWVFPDISGEWQGEIMWIDQSGGTGAKPVTIRISQTWLRFKVALKTDEAASESAYAWIEKDSSLGIATLAYVYGHVPTATSQQRNPAHEGTARLEFALGTPKEAIGSYYTARRTAGDITIRRP
jgi:hypothetical protein